MRRIVITTQCSPPLFSSARRAQDVYADGAVGCLEAESVSGRLRRRPQSGTLYENAEVEPRVAVDPANPLHIVGVFQQDRWSNGARTVWSRRRVDGGATWARVVGAFKYLRGRNVANGGDFQRGHTVGRSR